MDPAALATSGGTQFNTDPSQVQNFAQWQNMLQEYYKQGQAQMATNSAYAAPLTYGNIWGTNVRCYLKLKATISDSALADFIILYPCCSP